MKSYFTQFLEFVVGSVNGYGYGVNPLVLVTDLMQFRLLWDSAQHQYVINNSRSH